MDLTFALVCISVPLAYLLGVRRGAFPRSRGDHPPRQQDPLSRTPAGSPELLGRDVDALVRELERSNRELAEFASVVSHDLKSPLRGIASLADWIATDYGDVLDEEGREHLRLLRERTGRMHHLIEGILAYSRAGRGSDPRKRVDTSKVVRSVVELLSPPQNVEIQVEEPLPDCFCNETQVAQVFQNLIGNAIQHLGKPCGVVKVSGRSGPERIEFSVADDGVGIAPEHHERIFRIFQRLDSHEKPDSTGIGLSIVQKIVQRNGGDLIVESSPGLGTAFHFTLPGVE